MLRREIIESVQVKKKLNIFIKLLFFYVKKGTFHIYAINHIDEGIEILTGIKAGEPSNYYFY